MLDVRCSPRRPPISAFCFLLSTFPPLNNQLPAAPRNNADSAEFGMPWCSEGLFCPPRSLAGSGLQSQPVPPVLPASSPGARVRGAHSRRTLVSSAARARSGPLNTKSIPAGIFERCLDREMHPPSPPRNYPDISVRTNSRAWRSSPPHSAVRFQRVRFSVFLYCPLTSDFCLLSSVFCPLVSASRRAEAMRRRVSISAFFPNGLPHRQS